MYELLMFTTSHQSTAFRTHRHKSSFDQLSNIDQVKSGNYDVRRTSTGCGIKSARIRADLDRVWHANQFLCNVYSDRKMREHTAYTHTHARAHVIRHDFNFEH